MTISIFTTRIRPISPVRATCVPPRGGKSTGCGPAAIRTGRTRPAPRGGFTESVRTRPGSTVGRQEDRADGPNSPLSAAKSGPRRISLALQGGGAHGAFTWGVLDRLLEDERIVIEAVSGTSAGAMNAAALAAGFAEDGRRGRGGRSTGSGISTSAGRALQPLPAHPHRPARSGAGTWTARQATSGSACWSRAVLALPDQPARLPTAARRSSPVRSTSRRCAPARSFRVFVTATNVRTGPRAGLRPATISRSTPCSPRPACRISSRRWRSTATLTGTAATWAIRRSGR